jgi:putative addiction module component (TIGR02574 family)
MSVIEQIHQLSLQEKLTAMEAIWDDISSVEENLEIPQWHKDLLDEREKLIADGKARFIDWEEAKEQIKQAVK